MRSQGKPGAVNLMELQTISGKRYYWGDAEVSAASFLSQYDMGGIAVVNFEPLLLSPPPIKLTGTLTTQTTSATIGNLRGNTVQRKLSMDFAAQEFWGALVYARIYDPASEFTLVDMLGNVNDAEIDDEVLDLPITGFSNWSAIKAPFIKIDPSCSLTFGSAQCGSISGTPCQNSYGTCSAIDRFTGCVTLWSSSVVNPPQIQIAQPASVNVQNVRRAG